jgi:hypothetical protein
MNTSRERRKLMTREQMMNEVARTFGLESKTAIWFCTIAEDPLTFDGLVEGIFIGLMGF